ncbi:16S rRNA m(2)G 1207 methyltransferase [Celeribacter baekdonensis]|uniref:16S rRNA m(2)G 1207 methyltransferase n=1 Tax=Celeribacter baekdonensis TaxID=875171 RepID=A0A1G7M1K5_9RHOB|nr:methyltransferase [Celeribacter baekdonensis]SDF55514.1 16S rRNA m(2)G 1207 methyltransferase [Celeribacter baekdonensis]
MISSRLPLLLEGHDLSGHDLSDPVPARVVVYSPTLDADLSDLSDAHLQIVQGFKPDFDAFTARGFDTRVVAEGAFDLAIVAVPRSKAEARALIADAAARAPRVIVDGQKTDGIDSLLKDVRKRVEVAQVVSKAHGKAFAFSGGDFTDWADPGALHLIDGFTTRLGVFSVDRIDKASQALLAALPEKLPSKIADLGAGWGYLSRHILDHPGVKLLHVVEAEAAALACARENVTDPRAEFHWQDATKFIPPTKLDAVIMNPPFHTSRAADPGLGQAFIRAAAGMLSPQGQLWLVANRQLPYEATLAEMFGTCQQIADTGGFKVLHAAKPLRMSGKTA